MNGRRARRLGFTVQWDSVTPREASVDTDSFEIVLDKEYPVPDSDVLVSVLIVANEQPDEDESFVWSTGRTSGQFLSLPELLDRGCGK